MKNNMLKNYCKYNNLEDLKGFLSQNQGLDVLHNDGMCFKLVLQNCNIQIMKVLLEYYEKEHLTGNDNGMKHKVARYNLQNVLKGALQFYETTPEMQEVMIKYLPINDFDEDESNEDSFDDEVYNKVFCEDEKFIYIDKSTLIGDGDD